MRKPELRKLRRELTAEFRLTGNVTGCDVLDWYCRAGRARRMREIDTYDEAKVSLRTAAHAPHPLLSRTDRAVDAVLALLHARGIDVSRARSAIEAKCRRIGDVLESMRSMTPSRGEFFTASDGFSMRRVSS